MKTTHSRKIDGLTFYEGSIDGYPVVDVQSGEINERAELATYILDTTFHPRAILYSGTAGAPPRMRSTPPARRRTRASASPSPTPSSVSRGCSCGGSQTRSDIRRPTTARSPPSTWRPS
jgi:hypothetical protein